MSVNYCNYCDQYVDEDFNVEHYEEETHLELEAAFHENEKENYHDQDGAEARMTA